MQHPELVHDLLGYDGLKIVQRHDLFKLSLDAVLLADFARINLRAKAIIDLGTGLGPIPLLLSLKTKAKITGIEIEADHCALARKSVAMNNLGDQIEIIQDDIRVVHSRFTPSFFDLVITNPPFHKLHETSRVSPNAVFSTAKHELSIDFDTLALQAKRLLKTGGLFVFVHRAARLEELIITLKRHGFSLKRLSFVYPKPKRAALMMLVEAASGGKRGELKIEPPLIVHNDDGTYSEDALRIFRQKPGDFLETTQEL